MFPKKTYIVLLLMKKYFFLKTKDETDYNKRSKTMPMPVSYIICFVLKQR